MRKPSAETQLRQEKAEHNKTKRLLVALQQEMARRKQAGQMMANLCFNLEQDERYDVQHRQSMRDCHQLWDGIRSTTP